VLTDTFFSLPHTKPIHGSVKSVEDHGYIISFGTNEFTGFLVKDTAETTEGIISEASAIMLSLPTRPC